MTYLTQLLTPIIPPRFSKKRVAISIPSHVHIWKYLWPFRHKALCFSFAGSKTKINDFPAARQPKPLSPSQEHTSEDNYEEDHTYSFTIIIQERMNLVHCTQTAIIMPAHALWRRKVFGYLYAICSYTCIQRLWAWVAELQICYCQYLLRICYIWELSEVGFRV